MDTDKIKTQRYIFYATLIAFLAWLATIFIYILPKVIINPDIIDPMIKLLAVFGVGSITQFFITMLTIEIYFFFRKKPPTDTEKPEAKG